MLIFRDLICNLNFFLSLQPKWINQSGTSLALTRIKLAQMDSIEIKAIIKQGENSQVEFKECQDRISHSVYETVCSFLNYNTAMTAKLKLRMKPNLFSL